MILEIDNILLSSDILDVKFCCDIARCKGICCVEGNSGAPLDFDEVEILKHELHTFVPYMKLEGVEAVDKQGVMTVDEDGDLTTTLIDGGECAYSFEENGVTLCAIEKAYLEGKTTFRKPISCHLYPIRVQTFSNGSVGLNYHKWDVCDCALVLGEKVGTPIYKMLREPIIRRFGENFFDQLCTMEQFMKEQ